MPVGGAPLHDAWHAYRTCIGVPDLPLCCSDTRTRQCSESRQQVAAMAAERKLKSEIDRTLKKVQEGQDIFEDLWNQVNTAVGLLGEQLGSPANCH